MGQRPPRFLIAMVFVLVALIALQAGLGVVREVQDLASPAPHVRTVTIICEGQPVKCVSEPLEVGGK